MTNSELYSYKKDQWAKLSSSNIIAKGGLTTLFSIDALNLTIPKEKKQDKLQILDIGAGVGVLSMYAGEHYRNAEITATDYSEELVNVMNESIKSNSGSGNYNNIKTMVIDGMNMVELSNEQYDYAYSMFGLIYFKDRSKGFSEIYRVLKSNGGKVAIGSWQSDAFLAMMLELTYKQLTGNELPFKQPILSLSNSDQFQCELESAGFKNVLIHRVVHTSEVKDFQIFLSDINPPVADVYNILNPQQIEQFKQLFIDLSIKMTPKNEHTGCFQIKSPAFIGVGEKI